MSDFADRNNPLRVQVAIGMADFIFGDDRLPERFWSRVHVGPNSGCWLWVGARTEGGYGMFTAQNEKMAHRHAYASLVQPIPPGLVIDHLCRVPRCVNPAHLEAVTQQENFLRGNSASAVAVRENRCRRGHDLANAKTYTYPGRSGRRTCMTCVVEQQRVRRAAK